MSERLAHAKREFIQFWGDMATNWGISRTMAQIYAFLFCAEDAIDTDEIMAQLDISRGNANMNLRSLIDWGIVHKIEKPGTRKDYFIAEKDVWKLTAKIIQQRNQRELKPVSTSLQEITRTLDEADSLTEEEVKFRNNVEQLSDFLTLTDQLSTHLLPLIEQKDVQKLMGLISMLK
ncbi:MAG: transcriptional regulator [Bacteroidia bacterium]|nr:transcriptional regulator [Bacteroidia bacterium]